MSFNARTRLFVLARASMMVLRSAARAHSGGRRALHAQGRAPAEPPRPHRQLRLHCGDGARAAVNVYTYTDHDLDL